MFILPHIYIYREIYSTLPLTFFFLLLFLCIKTLVVSQHLSCPLVLCYSAEHRDPEFILTTARHRGRPTSGCINIRQLLICPFLLYSVAG
uniref:Putative secreted protein n=1 Tax=Ixodes ricinus TaxID=34613 RepID=A0A147BCP8_IXORI